MHKENIEYIRNIKLDLSVYKGKDLYNEGDNAESIVLDTFKNNLDPVKVLSEHNEWAILYQLSSSRKNIVSVINIDKNQNVLEIGSGMGAITGALAEKANYVDCIDLSKRRSYANAYRNQKYSNITIHVGNFEDIIWDKKYDIVVVIGVLEYAGSFLNSKEPYMQFLSNISNLLNDNGKVYIAIENKFGLKYFAGCNEDHLGIPFVGIEGYSDKKVRTFSYSEISELLNINFKDIYFYFPFPDYKLPSVIYSEDYLPNETASIASYLNYDADRLLLFDEEKVYKNIKTLEDWKMFSNSFLIEAVKK